MQGNYFGAARKALLEKDPDFFKVDFEKLEQNAKELRKERDAQPVRSEGPAGILQRLRRELFNLTERAKSTETYCCNKAGEVKLLEQQLTEAINRKKEAVASGNALAERHSEHSITRLEGERDEAEKSFQRAQRVAAESARLLKEWPHGERVKELEKSLAG